LATTSTSRTSGGGSHLAATSRFARRSRHCTPARRGDSLFARASANDDAVSASSLSAAEAAAAAAAESPGIPEANLRKDDPASADEYVALKSWLFTTTAKYGAGLTLYSTLGYGLANGLSVALGTAASLTYLVLLGEEHEHEHEPDSA